jgi:Mycothiol maleylpyruvate isomerase N-terminal domain/Putative zinc-finger
MNDGHTAVSELLGAWALDACSAEETATVEAHLAGCPACTAEADRLGRAAAGLGVTVAAAPPRRLRGAVLEAALARRPAARADAGAGYAAWVHRFDALLQDLTPEQWRRRVVHGWSVQDLVAHLSATDELLAAQLAPVPAAAPEGPAEADAALPARRSAAAIDEHRGRPPERTRTAWRAQADRLLRDAARPAAVRLLGGDQPAGSVRLVLTGPAGGDWTLPLGTGGPASTPAATVTMDAVEFCYLLGNRRDPGSVAHTVEGDPDLAATLLRAAATLGCD